LSVGRFVTRLPSVNSSLSVPGLGKGPSFGVFDPQFLIVVSYPPVPFWTTFRFEEALRFFRLCLSSFDPQHHHAGEGCLWFCQRRPADLPFDQLWSTDASPANRPMTLESTLPRPTELVSQPTFSHAFRARGGVAHCLVFFFLKRPVFLGNPFNSTYPLVFLMATN